MRGRKLITILLLAVSFLGLSSCNLGQSATPTADPNLVYTQIWVTVAAAQTQTGPAAAPTASQTVGPQASPTPDETNTPLLSPTPQAGTPSATRIVATNPGGSTSSCNNALWVQDVTIPDGTIVSPGETIVKTWQVQNLGPCSWNSNYRLIFSYQTAGTNWEYSAPVNFPGDLNPGENVEISITLRAPSALGGYKAWFRMQTDQWPTIGNNANFGPELSVEILVK